MSHTRARVHWLLWPAWALWRLLTALLILIGRFVTVLLGLLTMFIGVVLTLSVVGAILGVPIFIVGFLTTWRGIF